MKTQIYEMENKGFTGVRWKKTEKTTRVWFVLKRKVSTGVQANIAKLHEGLCFGYSTIWVTQMVRGSSVDQAVPRALQAGLLQQKAEMGARPVGWDSAVKKTVEDLSCKVKRKIQIPWAQTADRLSFEPGFFLVDIGIHWVAMGKDGDAYYFFDANEGLFRYDSRFEFSSDVKSADNFGWYNTNGWMTNPGKVCNCYEIV